MLHRGPAAVHADEVIAAGHLEFDGSAHLLGQHGGDQIGVLVLILVAEVASHVLADYAHVLSRDAQVPRRIVLAVGDAAGGSVNGEPVAIPGRYRRADLHLRVMHERGAEAVLKNVVGSMEAFVDIAALVAHRQSLIARVERKVSIRPDLRGAGLEGFFRFEDMGQRFVIHLDETQGLLGHMPVDCGHGGDGIAYKAHRIIEDITPLLGDLLDRIAVLLSAGDAARAEYHAAILMRDDGLDTR